MAGGISIPGLTVNSNGGGLQGGQSISFGGGAPLPISSTQVLGAESTGPGQGAIVTPGGQQLAQFNVGSSGGGSQQKQNGGWYNGQQYWAPGQGPQQNNGGGGQPNLPDINELYQPQMDFLKGLQGSLADTKSQQLAGIGKQYGDQQTGIQNQLAQLNTGLTTDKSSFGNQMQSAYAQAARDYDALRQRNSAMYGGQSSTGDASNQLLADTYARTQAGLQNTELQGGLQFQNEGQGINTWGSTQNTQLDQWKSQADDQINSIFQQGMNQINQDMASTEADKTQAKLQLLQQVVQHRQALDDFHTQLSGQIQAARAMMPNGSFDPSQYNNAISGLVQGVPGEMSGLQQMAQVAGVQAPQAQQWIPSLAGNTNRQDQSLLTMGGLIQNPQAQ